VLAPLKCREEKLGGRPQGSLFLHLLSGSSV
jgi:hypothetical protein